MREQGSNNGTGQATELRRICAQLESYFSLIQRELQSRDPTRGGPTLSGGGGLPHPPYTVMYFENVEEFKLIHIMGLVPGAWPVVDLQQMIAITIIVISPFIPFFF